MVWSPTGRRSEVASDDSGSALTGLTPAMGSEMTVEAEAPLHRRQYRNPPVIEAICRIQWSEPIPWNVTTPGLLFERLRDVYPEEPKAQAAVAAEVQPGSGFQLRSGLQKMAFSTGGGSRLLIVGPQDVAAHCLQPYEGWESLESRLYEGIDHISSLLTETTVSMAGLRYVNRVEIPGSTVRFDEYLTISIGFPEGFPSELGAFLDRTEMYYPGEPVKMAFTWASVESPPETSAFVLDLDLYWTPEPPAELDVARQALGDLKTKEGTAFESLLQDRLREMFDEIR